ncbi:MAG: galactokinase, partial [Acidobacteria bacterium]|nr:galactokinase [Acidobacteriota bacterium]
MVGSPPAHAWWVPGRLEVFGKHTDYAGGRTLVAAVPRGMAVVAGPRTDGALTVTDARTGERCTIDPSDPPAPFTGWRSYAGVALQRLARNFPGSDISGDIVFASDLPVAAG